MPRGNTTTSTSTTTSATTVTAEARGVVSTDLGYGSKAKETDNRPVRKFRLLAGRHIESHPTKGAIVHQHKPGKDTVVESRDDLPVLFPNKFAEVGKEPSAPQEVGPPPVVDEEISGDDVTADFPNSGERGLFVFRQGDRFAARRADGLVVAEGLSKERMDAFVAASPKG